MDTVTKYALNFIKNHWDEINKERCEITSKRKLNAEIKADPAMAAWVLTEVMSWGCEKDYLDDLRVEHPKEEEQLIIKIKKQYFKYDYKKYEFEECFAKTKKIVYFE